MKSLIGCLLLANLTFLSFAHAADPDAQVGWGLEFGGASRGVQPVYQVGLAVGAVPVFSRTYRANASQETPADDTDAEDGSAGWVPWVVGGVVAIVAIGTDFAKDYSHGCVGCANTPDGQVSGASADDDGATVGCVGDQCVVCPDGVASNCGGYVGRTLRGEAEIDVERQRWLDSGTGHMGDLLARRS